MQNIDMNKILDNVLIKANKYHHVCSGGSSSKLLDVYSIEPVHQCRYQGTDIWMAPFCKGCTGHVCKEMRLRDNEEYFNYGVKAMYNEVMKVINEKENN